MSPRNRIHVYKERKVAGPEKSLKLGIRTNEWSKINQSTDDVREEATWKRVGRAETKLGGNRPTELTPVVRVTTGAERAGKQTLTRGSLHRED